MTDKEIKKLRDAFPRFENGKPCELTSEQKNLHKELDCRDMINSCLCYGYNFLESDYSKPYIKELGKDKVLELYNEQKIDFDKSILFRNVYESKDGCVYNSIKWHDEIEENEINY